LSLHGFEALFERSLPLPTMEELELEVEILLV
jgi:hypothetical protein